MTHAGERTLIHKGAKFNFEQVTLQGPDGRIVRREVVRHPGAVVILPLLDATPSPQQRIVMIRNHRFTLDRELWELPAGTMEPPEPPDLCAHRELEEETGYQAAQVRPLASFLTTPGMTDELMHAFVATDLTKLTQRLEVDERIKVEIVTAGDALGMVDRGEIVDAKSMLTLLTARRRGLIGDRGGSA